MRKTIETLLHDGFILVFNSETLDVVKTARALLDAGICNMEVTCRIKNAAEKLRTLKREVPEFKAGAASLLDFPQSRERFNVRNPNRNLPSLDEMVDAGADYLVSAVNFRPETYAKYAGKLPIIPGCGTATEIMSQYELGANFCKLFPAAQAGGVKFLEAVDPAIHKMVSVMPTGGTTSQNIPDYITAGVLLVGGSFSMIEKETLKSINDRQDYKLLAAELRKVKDLIDSCRHKKYPSINFKTATLAEIEQATGRDFNAK